MGGFHTAGLLGIPARRESPLHVDRVVVEEEDRFGGMAERLGIDFDWVVTGVEVEAERWPKELFDIPAFLLLGLVFWLQRRRKRAEGALELQAA